MTKAIQAVDLFCGAGGASTALLRASGALKLSTQLLAVNHWPTAIATHSLNHPGVRHLCEDIERVNPREVVPGGRLQLLIAAPECTNHSRAKGGRPKNEQSRASAWSVLKWAQELYIDNILIENVEELREWGPLGANGKPLKSGKGQTYRAFLEALRSLGYTVEDRVLNAADYGDPTTRKRLFIIARRGNRPITWPAATHSKTGGPSLFGPMKKWAAARECIDFSLKGTSIFGRKKPLSPKTMARIMTGLDRFGGEDLKPFLVVLRNHGAGRSLDAPLPTVAASGQHLALAEPFVIPVTHAGGENRTHDLHDPLPTITCAHRGELAMVEPFLVGYHSEKPGEKTRTHALNEPLPTLSTENRFAVIQPFILQQQGGGVARPVSQPLPTIATGGFQRVVEPFLVPAFGERPTQAPRTHSVDAPLPTIAAQGRIGLAEGFIASYYGTQNISPITDPLPTVTTKDRFALVMPVVNGRALDIRLRMLKPRELAKAMSFGDDYQFTGNQGEQVKQIGNAWACRLGQALIQELLIGYADATVQKTTKQRAIA
jgi:DNA (cytosine-5)-methyltransferase 1